LRGGCVPPQVSFCPSEARVGLADRAVEGEMRSMSPSSILKEEVKNGYMGSVEGIFTDGKRNEKVV